MRLQEKLICKKCGFQSELGKLKNPHSNINICPECKDTLLMPLKVFDERKLKEKLHRHMYCRNCTFTGLVENFPFNGPPDDIESERYCPKCMSDDFLISLADLKLCVRCNAKPAQDNDTWCKGCDEEYAAACEATSDPEMDFD